MQYELEILEKKIKSDLTAFNLDTVIEQDSFRQLEDQILLETERIKKAFVKKAFHWKKEKQVEFYIQYHQEAIVHLIDHILEYLNPHQVDAIDDPSERRTRFHLSKTVYHSLEQLLAYIEKHFSKYFNQDAKSPESYRFVVHRDIREKLPDIRYQLEKKLADKRLLAIAFFPLDDFVEGIRKKEVSYRKLIYLKELLNELAGQAASGLKERKLDLQICMGLCYLNFNSNKFYKFCTREISRVVQEQESLTEKIEKLAYMLKLNNQIQVKPGFAFHPNARSFQDQLSEWISEELNYLEKRRLLYNKSPLNAGQALQNAFKIRTDLSVSQVACVLRILMDIGVIKNKNTLEILRFTASILQTKHTENVSWGSLRTKYYHPERHAFTVIKDVVIKFLNYTRKYT